MEMRPRSRRPLIEMKVWIAGALAVGVLAAILIMITRRPDNGGTGSITIDAHHDFGVMAPDQRGTHTFIIENNSLTPVRIEAGVANRLLLKVRDTFTIPPRETYRFEVSWRTPIAERGPDRFWGSAQLKTDCREQRCIDLVVTGDVADR